MATTGDPIQDLDAASGAYWEHFPHDADIGVRGVAPTQAGAFEQAALAMTAAVTDPTQVASHQAVELRLSAPDLELLLVEWLNGLVFEMSTRNLLFGRFAVEIAGSDLKATAWGETVDVRHHRPAAEVKGATYTALSVTRQADGRWQAQCVVDV